MHRTRFTLCALVLLTAGSAHAGIDNAGTTAGNFLSVGSGAAILSMGGATLGSGGDLHSAAWNPAALGLLSETQYALGHSSLAMQTSQEWLSAGGRVARGATRWSVDALYQGEGGFEGRDALNNSTGSFNVSNMALGLRVARPFGDAVRAGIGMRWVSENLGDAKGSGMGFDAGLQASAGQFGFGLAARNVGGSMKYDAASYDLPGVFGAGVSWSHPTAGVRVNLDANFPSAYYNDVRMGAEWRWKDRLALRAGYRKELSAPSDEPLSGPSFGLGVGAGGLWMDYGFLVGGADVQGQHRIGLTFRPSLLAGIASPLAPHAENAPAPRPESLAAAPEPRRDPVAAQPAPAKPEPAKSAPVAVQPAPVKAAAANTEPVAAHSEPLRLVAPVETGAAVYEPRASEPRTEALAVGRPVRAPKLIVPRPEPVSAPVAAKAPKPARAPEALVDAAAPVTLASAPEATPVATRAPQVEIVKPARVQPAEVAPPAPAPRPGVIVVKAGETLASIARRYDNSVASIMMENNLVSEQVKPGQKLKLPPAGRH